MLDTCRPGHPAPGPTLVVVPVKDEAERITGCLRALAGQRDAQADGIVLLVNNTSDATVAVVHAARALLPVPVHVVEHWFPPGQASAGSARRMGMEHAATLLGDRGVLLTTDADGRVPPDWVAANLWHLRAGADAVAGRAVLDPVDAALIPARLHDDDAQECAYAALLDEIAAVLDPEPWDPWPRHAEHSGASIAVSLAAYRRAGGMPAAALAEDRRFFQALRRVDARIRHAPEIQVVVSGRTLGRAEGGMADTIRRRLAAPDPYLDSALEPALACARRATLRHEFRRAHAGLQERAMLMSRLSYGLGLPYTAIVQACAGPCCGGGWAWLEAMSPALRRHQVAVADLPRELAAARRLRGTLRVGADEQAGKVLARHSC